MRTLPDHQAAAAPQLAALHEPRTGLIRCGRPGDRESFEHALAVLCRRDGCKKITVVGGAGLTADTDSQGAEQLPALCSMTDTSIYGETVFT
ncbi:hypothetical protein K353_05841 [Kitasatospora sp. SolWspMP-SS2h]|uniref:hypothetical protein n=1 Tax=Kitasatospora sp. SolWspMP-SS2h TaxID=1305729 RepID=UPI000DBAA888|nr:hypothetical protein [Kitasatospora sp. SolWspMP-SS2h]RAJ32843.1 hypothetical protein K353_05841 [Kitasatospora sp. SolWspMP-SS2h]